MNEIQTIHSDRKMAPLTQWLRSDTGGQKIVQWRLEKADWKQEQDLKYFLFKEKILQEWRWNEESFRFKKETNTAT